MDNYTDQKNDSKLYFDLICQETDQLVQST